MKFNHTAHKALWNWLAENPAKYKSDWCGWVWNGGEYSKQENNCFACDYLDFSDTSCEESPCPLIWHFNNEGEPCCFHGGLFSKWAISENGSKLRSRLARQIANLPVTPGVECE